MSSKPLSDLRVHYTLSGLSEADVHRDPLQQFDAWLQVALRADMVEPNAAALATATPDGRPSVRMVLLKGVDEEGFTFFTNYESRKAVELAANPRAALCFWWDTLQRQVRIEGVVEKTSAAESDAYFASRPRGSQIGAWASAQSRTVADRAALEAELADFFAKRGPGPIERPAFWGGYRLRPEVVEFWQGRENRLHDRLVYRREGAGWRVERLQP